VNGDGFKGSLCESQISKDGHNSLLLSLKCMIFKLIYCADSFLFQEAHIPHDLLVFLGSAGLFEWRNWARCI